MVFDYLRRGRNRAKGTARKTTLMPKLHFDLKVYASIYQLEQSRYSIEVDCTEAQLNFFEGSGTKFESYFGD